MFIVFLSQKYYFPDNACHSHIQGVSAMRADSVIHGLNVFTNVYLMVK